jgi:hypothetical protein
MGPAEVAGLRFSVRRSYSDRFVPRAQLLHFARRQLQTIIEWRGMYSAEPLRFNSYRLVRLVANLASVSAC